MTEPDPEATAAARPPRPGLGPVALGGLAAGVGAAVAGNQAWVALEDAGSGDVAFASAVDASAPPVTAVALVLLATWGVVLVTRGRFRRAVTWLGLVAAVAVLGFASAAWAQLPDDVLADLRTLDVEAARTAWSYVGLVAGVLAVVTSVLAVRGVARWPEMGRRYDAPVGAAPVVVDLDDPEQHSLDLWKAFDEGRDPTDPEAH